MKECDYGRIPPCYGSLERAIYEEAKKVNDEWKKTRARHGKLIDKLRAKLMEGGFLDDTHDKVYELNKQMCDLESGLSTDFLDMQVRMADKLAKDVVEGVRTPDWAKNMLAGIPEQLSRAEYEILEEILKEKNRFMEEKKTKKMTKAEVFEWLDGKKIRTIGNHEEVLRKLFDLGFVWKTLRDTRVDLGWLPNEVYGLTISNDEVAWWATPHSFETHGAEQVSVHDILSIEIVDENRSEDEVAEIVELGKNIQCLLPKLSGHRHVVITETDVLLYDEGMSLFHSDPF